MSFTQRINLTWTDGVSAPGTGSDSLGDYWGYEVDESLVASFVVPEEYTVGTDLTLDIHEATASVAPYRHKWEASVVLNDGDPQTFTLECVAKSVADVQISRSFLISSGGEVDNVAVAAGDVIEVTLSRVDATANEDTEDIRFYTGLASATCTDESVGACAGRLGKIVDKVLKQTKNIIGTFISAADIVVWVNECKDELALEGAWPTSTTLDIVASQAEYNLRFLIPDYAAISGITWTEDDTLLQPVTQVDMARVKERFSGSTTTSHPIMYHQRGDVVEFWPAPSEAVTDGIRVEYSRIPDDLGCTENFTPELPAVHDKVFTYYCIREFWDMDSGSKSGVVNYQKYQGLYQRAKTDVLFRDVDEISVRPG